MIKSIVLLRIGFFGILSYFLNLIYLKELKLYELAMISC
jgi:hypothetical protein